MSIERIRTLELAIADAEGRIQSNCGSNADYINQQNIKIQEWYTEIVSLVKVYIVTDDGEHVAATSPEEAFAWYTHEFGLSADEVLHPDDMVLISPAAMHRKVRVEEEAGDDGPLTRTFAEALAFDIIREGVKIPYHFAGQNE